MPNSLAPRSRARHCQVEFIGGYYAGSLAVMSDAAHLLSDVAAFCVSLLSLRYASRRSGANHTFGYHRLEVVGALFSVATLWMVTGILLVESCQRLRHPQNVRGSTMFAIALTGVLVNLALAAVLSGAGGHGHSHGGLSSGGGCGHSHATESVVSSSTPWTPVASELRQARLSHGHSHVGGVCGSVQTPLLASAEEGRSESAPASFPPGAVFFTRGRGLTLPVTPPEAEPEAPPPQEAPPCDAPPPESDLNTRGAYVHVLGDLLQSLGVLVAACIIWAHPRLHVLDPILTLLFSALVLATTTRLLRDVVDIVMARAPRGLETQAVAQGLAALPGCAGVHDLHIWALLPGKTVLTVHVLAAPGVSPAELLDRVQKHCAMELRIQHATVQVEPAA